MVHIAYQGRFGRLASVGLPAKTQDPEGARELGWAGGRDSDTGAGRVAGRQVVGSVGVVFGRGDGSEEVDAGVGLLGR